MTFKCVKAEFYIQGDLLNRIISPGGKRYNIKPKRGKKWQFF